MLIKCTNDKSNAVFFIKCSASVRSKNKKQIKNYLFKFNVI